MKKVLIIGGTGTISSPITDALSNDEGTELYVLNRGNKNSNLGDNIKIILADINNFEQSKEAIKDYSFDVVCNFIIFTKEQARNNIELFKDKTKQFIFISTVATYNHEVSCNCSEESELGNKFSSYGQNKVLAEKEFLAAYKNEAFPVTIVRPTQTYSESRIPLSVKGKTCWSVVSRMLRGREVIIHGDGQSVWASTHANDFAKAFLGLVGNEKVKGETYQIMNNEPHTWDMVYLELARLLNVECRPVYIPSDLLQHSKKYDLLTSIQGDKRFSNIFNIDKIRIIVPEFKCDISVNDGLKMYLEYMNDHPELKIEEPDFDKWCDLVIEEYRKSISKFIQVL